MNGNRSLVCAIRGPITLITVGVLFAFNNFTQYGFDKTWPVLLIVFGLLSLLRRGIEPAPAPPPPPNFPPQYSYPQQGSYSQSSYSQSTYSQPAPAKGGFGGSAPPKPDAAQNSSPQEASPKGDSV
jgi:hypothetical protein